MSACFEISEYENNSIRCSYEPNNKYLPAMFHGYLNRISDIKAWAFYYLIEEWVGVSFLE